MPEDTSNAAFGQGQAAAEKRATAEPAANSLVRDLPRNCQTLDDLPFPWNAGIGRRAASEKHWLIFAIADTGKAKPVKIPVSLTPAINGTRARTPLGIAVDTAAGYDLLAVLAACAAANDPGRIAWYNARLGEWNAVKAATVLAFLPGYLARPDSAMVVFDFDNVLRPDADEGDEMIVPWVIPALGTTYAEISVSLTGLRLLGARRPGDEKIAQTEAGNCGIFANGKLGAVITMKSVGDLPIADADAPRLLIAARWAAAEAEAAAARAAPGGGGTAGTSSGTAGAKNAAEGCPAGAGEASGAEPGHARVARFIDSFDALEEAEQIARAAAMFAVLPVAMAKDHGDWFRLGAAVRNYEHLYEVWDEWSKQAPNYGGTRELWDWLDPASTPADLVKDNKEPATIWTLAKVARKHGWRGGPRRQGRGKADGEPDEEMPQTEGFLSVDLEDPDYHTHWREITASVGATGEAYLAHGSTCLALIRKRQIPNEFREAGTGEGDPTGTLEAVPVYTTCAVRPTTTMVSEVLARVLHFYRFNVRQGDWTRKAGPIGFAHDFIRLQGEGLPPLKAVIDRPMMRPDGSFCMPPPGGGYHPELSIYITERGRIEVPEGKFTRGQALEFLRDEWLCDVAFQTRDDFLRALTLPLTILLRTTALIMDEGVMAYAFVASQSGAGKTTLVKALVRVVTGQPVPATSFSAEDAEQEKKMVGLVEASPAAVLFDNIARGSLVMGETIEKYTTSSLWQPRRLGVNENPVLFTGPVPIFTGNGIQMGNDMPRRTLIIWLVPAVQDPAHRDFRHANLLQFTDASRPDILSALQTVYRTGISVPREGLPVWRRTVGKAVNAGDTFASLRDGPMVEGVNGAAIDKLGWRILHVCESAGLTRAGLTRLEPTGPVTLQKRIGLEYQIGEMKALTMTDLVAWCEAEVITLLRLKDGEQGTAAEQLKAMHHRVLAAKLKRYHGQPGDVFTLTVDQVPDRYQNDRKPVVVRIFRQANEDDHDDAPF